MRIIITERQLEEINRFQMKDNPKYRGCLMSDLTRMELIDNFLQKVDEDSEYNTEEPDYDMLLDDWDGYDDQVYIQNKGESIVFWEGWVDSCWKAAFQKEQYKGLKKSEVINKIIEERFPRIAEEFDMEIIDYGFIDNDGYIMYIEMKKKSSETDIEEEFKRALDELTTLDLEDDQVRIPQFNEDTDTYIIQVGKVYLHIRNRDELPQSGAFELFILNVKDEVIGFIRGTKKDNIISFNLFYIFPEERGMRIGSDIYKYFLNNGYTIKSDDEITDSTQSLYLNLLKEKFKPIIYDDGRVGLKK